MAAVANMGASGSSQVSTTTKGNALPTPTYNGVRNAREIDNFFWFETYFGATGLVDEGQKVSQASYSLKNIALVWWRHRCDDVNRGSTPITTWEGFKKELEEQFYPKDAEREAKVKLRCLQHKEGHLREYVKKFQEPLLEIPSMGEQDALFCFLDGLCG